MSLDKHTGPRAPYSTLADKLHFRARRQPIYTYQSFRVTARRPSLTVLPEGEGSYRVVTPYQYILGKLGIAGQIEARYDPDTQTLNVLGAKNLLDRDWSPEEAASILRQIIMHLPGPVREIGGLRVAPGRHPLALPAKTTRIA